MASIKLTRLIHRARFDDLVGEGVLTVDMEMDSGYRGRGLIGLTRIIPAGTKVKVHVVPAYSHRYPLDRTQPDWMERLQFMTRPMPDAPALWELETDYLPTQPGENSHPFRKSLTAGLYVPFRDQFIAKHPEAVVHG